MSSVRLSVLALAGAVAMASAAQAQPRPYIGFAYPAGGQQGTTFQVRLGGQGLDDVDEASVSGRGVTAKVVEYRRRLGPQEIQLLREQLRELKRAAKAKGKSLASVRTGKAGGQDAMMSEGSMMDAGSGTSATGSGAAKHDLPSRIETRIAEYCQRPACASISSIALVEVTVAPNAEPGRRELTVATPRGVSNPLVFFVGQVPEVSRKPMYTADFQVLGKEELALRKRPDDEVEQHIALPCTLNGQIASGEVNRYRFEARKGQRLVISAAARQLVPFIADAVPGWFQPVMTLCDAGGKELAYNDDYRFKPDPVIFYEVPRDGEYLLNIHDAIYRGREDFVYRVTIGELPFVTSIFPLGSREGTAAAVRMNGWNLDDAEISLPARDASPGVYLVGAGTLRGFFSNRLPFAVDTLPECLEKEPNDDPAHAQAVKLPIVVNGRIQRKDDWDVFRIEGRAGDTIVAEVSARRLESPLDSFLKVTDASGKVVAFNDDYEDPAAGVNTHHADSYLMGKLPADGPYYVHLGDTARSGGEEYAYRLRISPPRPDFTLFAVPTTVGLRSKSSSAISIYALRKDGFNGPIKLSLKDPPEGFSSYPVTLSPGQSVTRFGLKTVEVDVKEPVTLAIEGRAKIGDREVAHVAVPAEDRMQAFLWRHLVPAQEIQAVVFNPSYEPPAKRVRSVSTPPKPATAQTSPSGTAEKPKFTKRQVAGRLRQLKLLYEEGLLTDSFYDEKIAECEAAL